MKAAAALLIALALSGCVEGGRAQPLTHAAIHYACPDGSSVAARYIGGRAWVSYRDRTMAMDSAPAASGARYTGGGWQWWTRGMHEGMIAPLKPGESIASAPGQSCTATRG